MTLREGRRSINRPTQSRYLLRSHFKAATSPLKHRASSNYLFKGSNQPKRPRGILPLHRAPPADSEADGRPSSRSEKVSFESFSEACENSLSSESVVWDVESMQSSSSVNTTETTTTGHEASTQTTRTKKAKITYKQLLEFRGIDVKHSPDDTLKRFGLHNVTSEVNKHLVLNNAAGLVSLVEKHVKRLKAFMKHGVPENGFQLYEALKEDVDGWRPVDDDYRRFPTVSSRYFSLDREHCMTSSEADFQRTVMMAIIDRYDFQDLFTYSCEEQWTVEADYLLPTRGNPNKIPQPSVLHLLLEAKKNFQAAVPLYERAIDGYSRVLGTDHPTTVACTGHLSLLLWEMEQQSLDFYPIYQYGQF